jgi:4'-phosphopantetheinyl transferase
LVEPLLSEAERERALRFKSGALRLRYTIGHGSLRVIIRDIYGIPVERQELSRNEFGKPFLTRFPQLHFSISYGGEHVLIGVNEGAAIGVDIEIARIIADASDLSEFHYTMREREEMCRNGPSEAELSRRFLNVWVKKEACVKALGRGLGIPLNEVECGGGALEATVQLSERQHYRTGIIQLRGDPILAWARSII